MSRFNQKKVSQHLKFDTVNYEGEKAHLKSPEMELYSMACTSMLSNQYYRTGSDTLQRLIELIDSVDCEFAKKLAVYTREQMYLRTFPLVMAVLLSIKKKASVEFISRIIQRGDELTEILAIYQAINGKLKPLPNVIKKGIAEAFNKFDSYQIAKYKRDDKDITLRDAMFISHPKPKEEMIATFKKLADKTLEPPYTWEVELSAAKEKGKTKQQVWHELIDSKRLGYMAMLRNLRNFMKEGVSIARFKKVCKFISDPVQVRKSKQLPFRFLAAYNELQDHEHPDIYILLDALEKAISVSVENIPGFEDQTLLIASDVSGSMNSSISARSTIQQYEIGLLLSMLLQKVTRCYTGIFGTEFLIKQLPKDNILANTSNLNHLSREVGWSTNGYKVIEWLIRTGNHVDKIMIFTDCQLWDSYHDRHIAEMWIKYKSINPKAKLYLFDLSGYDNTPLKINERDVFLIAGWSDKIFNALDSLEKGNSILDVINEIEVDG
jgi:hypothetical protein